VAALAVGRAVHAQGRYPHRRRQAGRRRRRVRDPRSPTTAGTTSTGRRPPSGCCPTSPGPSATRSRCCSTAACGAAATSSRRLALGGRGAVMIGRAYLWGLSANGQAGVENVLDLMRSGIDACLLGPRALVDRRAVTRRPGHTARVHAAAGRLTPDQRHLDDCAGIFPGALGPGAIPGTARPPPGPTPLQLILHLPGSYVTTPRETGRRLVR